MKAVGAAMPLTAFSFVDRFWKRGSLKNEKGEMVYSVSVEKFEELVGEGIWVGHVFFNDNTKLRISSIGQIKDGKIEIGIESSTGEPLDSLWESCLESIHAMS